MGEGMFGDGYPGETELPTPFIAARWDDDMTALSAAPEGSRVCSTREGLCVV